MHFFKKFSNPDQNDFSHFPPLFASDARYLHRLYTSSHHKTHHKMTKKILKNKFSGFTLIELMIGLVIFSLIMTMILSSVHSMTLARIKNMNRIALTDQLYLFSEQLFTTIKNGGTIDYEEYWNRNSFDTNAKN